MQKNKKRTKVIFMIFAVQLAILLLRMFYIQIYAHEELAETARLQHLIAVEGIDTRGIICDRFSRPITNAKYVYYYIIDKEEIDAACRRYLELAGARKHKANSLRYEIYRSEKKPDANSDFLKKKYGAYIFRSADRYADSQPACHIIGYLNEAEKRGVSGMELMLERELGAVPKTVNLVADARGKIIGGCGPYCTEDDVMRSVIVTTLDLNLQKKCEKLLEGKGACIVSDVETGEIYAMTSAPSFNPNKIEDYLGGSDDCLINRAVQSSYPPGSVFKLVVAAAALQEGISEDTAITCRGSISSGEQELICATAEAGGHGSLDMKTAMAKSCNAYFVQLGEKLGNEKILEMAQALGLGEAALRNFPEEARGNLPAADKLYKSDTANLSIGQGEILATPVQVMRMVNIIAGGGVDRPLRLIKEDRKRSGEAGYMGLLQAEGGENMISEVPSAAEYEDISQNGDLARRVFSKDSSAAEYEDISQNGDLEERVISKEAALSLQEMMVEVMEKGTGHSEGFEICAGGKTGTAEVQDGYDCWFAGYCDVGQRRFSVVVLVENGVSGSASCLPVFREIAEYLSENYSQNSAR